MNLTPTAWIEAIEKYLGQTKGWLSLHQRVKTLETRVAQLEAGKAAKGDVCAHCGSIQLTRKGTRPSPGPFGAMGLQEAIYECGECHHTTHIEIPLD
jgi:hypothetical protein